MIAAVLLLVSYGLCIIVAGHGATPLGLMLLWTDSDAWFVHGKIIGWLGIASLAATALSRQKSSQRAVAQLVSAGLLYLSWFDIARRADEESGSFLTTFVLSLPFQIIFLVVVSRLAIEIRQLRAGAGRAS